LNQPGISRTDFTIEEELTMGRKDYVGGGIFIALGIFILLMTFSFPSLDGRPPGPSLVPGVLAVLFIFFGGVVVLHGWRSAKGKTEDPPEEEGPPPNRFNPILVIVLVAAFIALAETVGFFITGAVMLSILMLRLRVSALKSVIVSTLLVAVIYTIFSKGLRVPLPIGYLGW
jgi:putative tricarboxylic transport membrane protein